MTPSTESCFVFFFDFVDFFLGECFERGAKQFSSFGQHDGFGAIEELSDGSVFGLAFHVSIEGEGVLNDEGFGFGLRSESGRG